MTEDAATEGLKSAVVLMVDDEPTTLDVIEMFLHGEGYRDLVKITDPRKAFEMIAGLRPDVVLLNLMMPDVSGLEILTAMRRDPSLQDIPAIIITGSSDAALKRQALELGAADFLGKPVDPSELALRLRNTLATRAWHDGDDPERARPDRARPSTGPLPPQEDRIRTIVDTFLARLQPRLGAMEASLESGDFSSLASLAHWLKGAAGTVGLHEFTDPAEAVGRFARQGQAEPIAPLLRKLRRLATEAGARAEG